MKTLLKTVAVAMIVAEVLTVSAFAQVASLPIGSTNAVLLDALRQVNGLQLSVELISRDGLYVEQFLASHGGTYSYEQDGDPAPLLERKMKELIERVSWNKPEYEGRMFQTSYDGWKDLPAQNTAYLVFGTSNEFTLVRNEKGELAPPPVAYQIDLVAALMRGYSHAFFIPNIYYALLEVADTAGNVILKDDSRTHVVGGGEGDVVVNRADEVVGFTTTLVTSGQRGKITVGYKNGIQQVFSLADGHLLPSLSLRRVAEGMELLVSSTDAFTIEASDDLREWRLPYLPPVIQPASEAPVFLHRFTDSVSAGKRFYRLRIESVSAQNRR